jgi:hypothetical protein
MTDPKPKFPSKEQPEDKYPMSENDDDWGKDLQEPYDKRLDDDTDSSDDGSLDIGRDE